MATCMLCSSRVEDGQATCPHCGGAVADDHGFDRPVFGGSDDPTRVAPPAAGEASPWAAPGAAPPAGSPPAGAPPWDAPPFGAPSDGEQPYGPSPYGAPPSHGEQAYGPSPYGVQPGGWPSGGPQPYGAPPVGPGPGGPAYGAPGYGAPAYGAPAYGYGYGGAPAYGQVGGRPQARTNGMAIGSLVTSLAALLLGVSCLGFPLVASPVGAVLGHVSLRGIGRTGDQGRGMALAGIIMGWIGTAIGVLLLVLIVAVAVSG